MSNVKYYYDSETLTYRPLKKDSKRLVKNTFIFLFASAIFGFGTIIIAEQFFESPREKALNRELQNLDLQYSLLNKKITEAEEVLANVENRDNGIYRLYFEANPIPVKWALSEMGKINKGIRLPLVDLDQQYYKTVRSALIDAGIKC